MTTLLTLQKKIGFSILFILSIVFTSHADQIPVREFNVQFKTDESKVTKAEYDRLKKFYLNTLAEAGTIELCGHTDARGSDEYNLALSERRVTEVKNLLIEFGFKAENISIRFVGESQPKLDNNSENGRKENRRVTITWEEPDIIVEPVDDSHIRDLYKLLEQEKQEFCIDPQRDTILVLDQGTVISVPANAFNTNSNQCVKFRAKEVYKFSDMIMENLSTTSSGRALETGGMIYTEAEDQNGNPLTLNPGKELTIMLPTNDPKEGMQLFYGQRDPHTDDMDWTLSEGIRPSISWYNPGYCNGWSPSGGVSCEKCGILFCRLFGRIDETFSGAFNQNQRSDNKSFRQCQRELRRRNRRGFTSVSSGGFSQQNYCDSLFDQYGVDNWQALNDTLQKIREAKRKEQMENIEKSVSEGSGNISDVQYYVMQTSRLGWVNCDVFSSYDKKNRIDMLTDITPSDQINCSLIINERRSLFPADREGKKFTFKNVVPGLAVWILALKYKFGRAYLSLEKGRISESTNIKFREVSIDELKTELRKLDQ